MSMYLNGLQKGDPIDLVAPASACSKSQLKLAIAHIKKLGFDPVTPDDMFASKGLFSHDDEYRFQHLKNALCHSPSKAVWCVRGGYGSIRLLKKLATIKPPKQAKIFMGFSDITVLHQFLNQQWGWPSYHTPGASRLGSDELKPIELKDIKTILQGTSLAITHNGLRAMNEAALKNRTINASLCGGNLATIATCLGSFNQLDANKKILFLEEVNERGYVVDRMLQSLSLAGVLKGVRAIVLGDFNGGEEPNGKNFTPAVLSDFAQSLKIPVYKGLKVGHYKVQRSLCFNTPTQLQCGERAKLICDTQVQST